MALLHWLNQSQCRQFSLAYHDLASRGLLEWHEEFGGALPLKRDHLWEIPAATLERCAGVFDRLAKKVACYRESAAGRTGAAPRNGSAASPGGRGAPAPGKSLVGFGPTAAAKILFVLRPKVFVAWDEPVRTGLRYDGSGCSYVVFLLRLREELLELREQCRAFDLELTDLPAALGRPLSTPAQLMDEYYWATVTRGVVAPSRQQVARWLAWYAPPEQPTLISRSPVAASPARGGLPEQRLVAPPVEE
jgi:hypothetical protein